MYIFTHKISSQLLNGSSETLLIMQFHSVIQNSILILMQEIFHSIEVDSTFNTMKNCRCTYLTFMYCIHFKDVLLDITEN